MQYARLAKQIHVSPFAVAMKRAAATREAAESQIEDEVAAELGAAARAQELAEPAEPANSQRETDAAASNSEHPADPAAGSAGEEPAEEFDLR